jgi:Abortive infection alpha
MTDELRDTAEAVKGIVEAVPVYQDVLQPAAKELGAALQTVAKTIHIALAPITVLVWGYDEIREFVSTRVAEKLSRIPAEKIQTPKPNVAGPALEALRYTGHEETLREMYANLLATAMNVETGASAHPAFVEIIRQLTPDEARIVQLFTQERAFPLLNLRVELTQERHGVSGGKDIITNFSLLGHEAGSAAPELTPMSLDNLCRLGLTEIPTFFQYTSPGVYDALEQHATIVAAKKHFEQSGEYRVILDRKGLRVTQLGRQFCSACVIERSVVPAVSPGAPNATAAKRDSTESDTVIRGR